MRHDKLERELDLLLLLTENVDYTAQDLCDKLGITRRNLYYYLDFLRDTGFELIKSGTCYRLNRQSPFFRRLHESIDFTENEAIFLRRLLEQIDNENPLVGNIKVKLDRFYDLKIINDAKFKKRAAHNVETLYEAIKIKHVVRLVGYSSPHSKTVSDRFVEPFTMMNDNNDVRCYEMSSGMNKTFKISRMRDVQVIDAVWGNEDRHREIFTDIFMFSGEERRHVELLLGQLSYNLLLEEYPQAVTHLTLHNNKRWLLNLDVCSFLGIGRFVLGLYDDIEVIGDKEFTEYLIDKANKMSMFFGKK